MEEFLTCPICGANKRNLTKHITMMHHITKEEILLRYPNIKLISESSSNKISEALKKNWKDPEYAERCSSYWRSDLHANRKSIDMKNQWKDPETRKVMLKGIREFSMSDKGRKIRSNNLSNTLDKLWKDPDYVNDRRLQGQSQMIKNMNNPEFNKYHRVNYNGVNYRSNLEVQFAKLFDELGIDHEYESVRLKYVYNDFTHVYIPDFYLKDYNTLVEIKPTCYLDELSHGKADCARSSKYNYIILTESDLSKDAVLNKLPTISLGN